MSTKNEQHRSLSFLDIDNERTHIVRPSGIVLARDGVVERGRKHRNSERRSSDHESSSDARDQLRTGQMAPKIPGHSLTTDGHNQAT